MFVNEVNIHWTLHVFMACCGIVMQGPVNVHLIHSQQTFFLFMETDIHSCAEGAAIKSFVFVKAWVFPFPVESCLCSCMHQTQRALELLFLAFHLIHSKACHVATCRHIVPLVVLSFSSSHTLGHPHPVSTFGHHDLLHCPTCC